MIAKIRQAIAEYDMLKSHDRVVVGVSGGVDSLVLLHVLTRLDDLRLELHIAHLDHALRPESATDADFVRAAAERVGLPFHTERADVETLALKRSCGLEEAARHARYGFLRRVAAAVDARRIAVGHNADDQAETVLLHLLRGTGLNGLTGMSPHRADGVIRPLLGVTRREIMDYAKENALQWVEDESNKSLDFRRNRIRHKLLPLLEEEYNPNIRVSLRRLAEVSRAAEEFITEEALHRISRSLRELNGSGVVVSTDSLTALPLALQREALRSVCRRAQPDRPGPSFERVEALRAALAKGTGGWTIEMGSGLTAQCSAGLLELVPSHGAEAAASRPAIPLPHSGTVSATEYELVIRCEVRPWHGSTGELKAMPRCVACFDLDQVAGSPVLREWKDGETFRPLGRTSPVRISDFLAKQGVPAQRRHGIPVLADQDKVLWLVGLRPAEDARLADSTRRAYVVSIAAL